MIKWHIPAPNTASPPPNIRILKFVVKYFWAGFHPSDWRQYFGSFVLDLQGTSLIITGSPLTGYLCHSSVHCISRALLCWILCTSLSIFPAEACLYISLLCSSPNKKTVGLWYDNVLCVCVSARAHTHTHTHTHTSPGTNMYLIFVFPCIIIYGFY